MNLEASNKIFTLAWEFPPIMSGESVVCLRTLKYSRRSYDVCCGMVLGSYADPLPENICAYPLKGKYFSWPFRVAQLFRKLNRTNDYQVMLSRVMPPNGHLAGLLIKLLKPKIKWVVYFSDPIWNSPFIQFSSLFKRDGLNRPNYLLMKFYGIFAKIAIQMSDLLIFNNERLARYILGDRYEKLEGKVIITPYGHEGVDAMSLKKRGDHLVLAHIGQVYGNRSLDIVISAVSLLKEREPLLYAFLKIQQVGFLCKAEHNKIQYSGVTECFELIDQVDYAKSLEYMRKADCLLIIDPKFENRNSNLYVPAKIYDYMSTGKPFVAITDEDSATSDITNIIGNLTVPHDAEALYAMLARMLQSEVPHPNLKTYEHFHCRYGTEKLDLALDELKY